MCNKIAGLLLMGLAVVVAGCALPKNSVAFFHQPNGLNGRDFETVPTEWDNRLFRVADPRSEPSISLGGEATHVHSIAHEHHVESDVSSSSQKPFGLKQVAASATHRHPLQTTGQSPLVSGSADTMPPARELVAEIARTDFCRPPPGLIVGYTGVGTPEGWRACDGTSGTPDLRNLYVLIRRFNAVEALRGSDTHHHDATHAHTWIAGAPTTRTDDPQTPRNYAFLGDTAPATQPDFGAIPVGHTHVVVEQPNGPMLTDDVAARPPTIVVHYIEAGPAAKEMPRGAVLPYTGNGAPLGWSMWRSTADNPVFGRFPAGDGNGHAVGTTYGSEIHTHHLVHHHNLLLLPTTTTAIPAKADQGPGVAVADHGHTATVDADIETGPGSSIPPYVSVPFIVKD